MRSLPIRAGLGLAGAELTRESSQWLDLIEPDCLEVFQFKSPLKLDSQGEFTLPDAPGLSVERNELMLEQTLSKTAAFH